MYDVYIYTSYAFTFFALGCVIAVSLIGLARSRKGLAALQDTKDGDS